MADNNDDDKGRKNGDDKPTVESLTAELERMNVKYGLEKGHRKTAETSVKDFENRIGTIEEERKTEKKAIADEKHRLEIESHKDKGDWDAYKKSTDELRQKDKDEYTTSVKSLHSTISDLTVNRDAQKLANRLAGDDAHLILPVVKNRLRSEITDGKASTSVLDAKGNVSALTLDELQAEIYNDKQYSRIIVESNGSGGGVDGSSAKRGSSATKTMTRSSYEAIALADRPNLAKEGITLTD